MVETQDHRGDHTAVVVRTAKEIRRNDGTAIRFDRNAAVLGKLTDFTVSMWIQYDGGASRLLFSMSDGGMSHRVVVCADGEWAQQAASVIAAELRARLGARDRVSLVVAGGTTPAPVYRDARSL